ncbi:hypothetical protein XBP1_660006 [Xenorhabdus bovienii str. puntauvense]|uniref:Uncharacterized protein n=2 Tax=Xenorhabdus bovienii TaxID=40576 RepID=A0A077NMS3_XENBV|nr:hypothetical protein XBP1_660006 [Xenorhabdus bovienii str. puntauvense]CDH00565.1 hypothetical protein XBFM1_1710033 [Xenorhabdus bovienii str. feltiae Moldova]
MVLILRLHVALTYMGLFSLKVHILHFLFILKHKKGAKYTLFHSVIKILSFVGVVIR